MKSVDLGSPGQDSARLSDSQKEGGRLGLRRTLPDKFGYKGRVKMKTVIGRFMSSASKGGSLCVRS